MPFELDGFLPYRLSVAAAQISRRFAALYGAEAGINMPEWRVLAHLDRAGVVSVRDIHMRVHLDKSVISRAATRLEKAGLLRKSAHDGDRRLVALELTPQGQALMRRLGRMAARFQAQLARELGTDAEVLNRVLTRLTQPDTRD